MLQIVHELLYLCDVRGNSECCVFRNIARLHLTWSSTFMKAPLSEYFAPSFLGQTRPIEMQPRSLSGVSGSLHCRDRCAGELLEALIMRSATAAFGQVLTVAVFLAAFMSSASCSRPLLKCELCWHAEHTVRCQHAWLRVQAGAHHMPAYPSS